MPSWFRDYPHVGAITMQIKFNCTKLIYAWNTSVSPVSGMCFKPLFWMRQREMGTQVSPDPEGSHTGQLTYRRAKFQYFVPRFPETSLISATSRKLQFHLSLSSLHLQAHCGIRRWVTCQPPSHCTGQVKLSESSLWILGCKCQLQVLPSCSFRGHSRRSQNSNSNMSQMCLQPHDTGQF